MNHLKLLADIVSDVLELDIRKKTRKQEYVEARYIYYKIARDTYFNYSLEKIGKEVRRDHATVIHGLSNVDMWIEKDRIFREKYELVLKYFKEKIDGPEYITTEMGNEIITENAILKSANAILVDKLYSLSLQMELLEHQVEKYNKFGSILDRITQQVPVQKIPAFEQKLNRFMNGIQL
jgi:hypothetical protein